MDSLIKEIETLRKQLAAAQARIKELRVAKEVDPTILETDEPGPLFEFAQRFLAAYLAEQEPPPEPAPLQCHKRRNDPCKCSRKAMLCDGFGPSDVCAAPSSEEMRKMLYELGWYADKIHAYGDYAKGAAAKMLKAAGLIERLAFREKK